MNATEKGAGGWSFVADTDEAAALFAATLDLDPSETYTKSALADAAGVPMKRLYLSDALAALAEMGLLDPVDTEGEDTYAIDADSPVYQGAAVFDEAVREARTD